jgi:hypothetical protein
MSRIHSIGATTTVTIISAIIAIIVTIVPTLASLSSLDDILHRYEVSSLQRSGQYALSSLPSLNDHPTRTLSLDTFGHATHAPTAQFTLSALGSTLELDLELNTDLIAPVSSHPFLSLHLLQIWLILNDTNDMITIRVMYQCKMMA